jgi:hypothetical protein
MTLYILQSSKYSECNGWLISVSMYLSVCTHGSEIHRTLTKKEVLLERLGNAICALKDKTEIYIAMKHKKNYANHSPKILVTILRYCRFCKLLGLTLQLFKTCSMKSSSVTHGMSLKKKIKRFLWYNHREFLCCNCKPNTIVHHVELSVKLANKYIS